MRIQYISTSIILPAIILLASIKELQADYILSFTPSGEATSYVLNEGSTIAIPVYITQTGDSNALTSPGLASVGFDLKFTPDSHLEIVTIAPAHGIEEFFSSPLVTGISFDAFQFTSMLIPNENQNFIHIANVTIKGIQPTLASTIALELSIGDITPRMIAGNEVVDEEGIIINEAIVLDDAINTTNASIIVSQAIPEPSSISLVAMTITAAYAFRKRRRKQSAT